MSIKLSYAQNREDIILDALLSDIEKGFYVDVGANHPEDDSVTHYFYLKGWNGINIEPTKELYQTLSRERPRDINLNIGISNKPGKLKFRQYKNHGLSTFSTTIQKQYRQNSTKNVDEYKEYEVEVTTLKDVFQKHAAHQHINFLKVDVEGYEYEVLAGNDWKVYRPEVICIEANHIVKDWRPLLAENNYTKVFFDGLNEYYVAQEKQDRAEKFSYPEQVLLGPPVIHISTYSELQRRETEKLNIKKKYQLAKTESNRLRQHIEYLNEEAVKGKHIKNQLKSLLVSVDQALNTRIDALRRDKSKIYDKLINTPYDNQTASSLLLLVRQTDFTVFYHLTHTKQIRYYFASGLYKFLRGSTKATIKGSLKAVRKVKRKSSHE